jgi:hypothetical protein
MAAKIEVSISSSRKEGFSSLQVKVDDPEDTLDILSPKNIASLEIFGREFKERWDPIINRKEVGEIVSDEGHQSYKEEQ